MNGFLVILTGGTIDSDPDLYTGEAVFTSEESPTLHYLEKTYGKENVSCVNICQEDSKDLTVKIFAEIVNAVSDYNGGNILITLGTDAMEANSEFIADEIQKNSKNALKSVRMTGAMLPILDENSTAKGNLTCSLADMRTNPGGVKVVMDGEVFIPGQFKKDMDTKRFISTSNHQVGNIDL